MEFAASLPAGAAVRFTVGRVTAESPGRIVVEAVMHVDAGDKDTTVGWLDTWVKGPTGWQSSFSVEKRHPGDRRRAPGRPAQRSIRRSAAMKAGAWVTSAK